MSETNDQKYVEQEKRLRERMQRIKYKLIVMSGKGGVGKTTMAVNLAVGLARRGLKVGLLDVDIHGPNIAKMLGIEHLKCAGTEEGVEAAEVSSNLRAVSISMLMKDADQPVIWRGPLKMLTIKQFLSDVLWGELDYLIVDSPPGTGDEPLSVCQLIPGINGAVIVTTPQAVALMDARKSVRFAQSIKVPVTGLIENMSGFICPHCRRPIDLYGSGGGEQMAVDMQVPFLGRVAFDPQIIQASDAGEFFLHPEDQANAAGWMDDIVDNINARLLKERLSKNETGKF